MGIERTRKIPILIFFIFIILSTGMTPAVATVEPARTEGTIHERIAGMSDEDVRKSLIATMQEQSSTTESPVADQAQGPGATLGAILDILARQSDNTRKELSRLVGSIPESMRDVYDVVSLNTDGKSGRALRNILWVLFFIGIGLMAEQVVNLFLRKKYYHLSSENLDNMPVTDGNMSITEKLAAMLAKKLPSLLGLFVFFGTAYFSYFTFVWTDSSAMRFLFLAVLLTITIIRFFAVLAEMFLSPFNCRFRVLPLGSAIAGISYRLIVWTFGYIVTVIMFSIVIHRLGARLETVVLIRVFSATVLLALTAWAVVLCRKQVEAYILTPSPEEAGPPSRAKQSFAPIWHFFALFYLLSLWFLMIMSVVDPDAHAKGAFLLSFFALPIWMLGDWVLKWLVKHTMLSLRLYEEESPASRLTVAQDAIDEQHREHELFLKVRQYARFALFVAVVLWVASLWGYTIPFISNLSGVLFDSLIIMALALLFWQFISSRIEGKINESLPGDAKHNDLDDEWGVAPAQGRFYTLLPVVRSFVASILIVVVTLTILSSMGVDIGPLLAGAGVVGLAIGFGAQKIVADIFSGIFYLFDDAFRVGEYLTTGSISGTVEKISLRNVMLRHHRGMLQIVPHSDLGTITNYMRGGIIEKFSLDFAYDADIEKIRKIIKKVGQEMLEDPELGKNFISPIKSQGVRQITNSVMTIRVKFTAKPGSQFVIRREAFKRITAAMHAKGIHYAHKKVIVDLPAPVTGHEDADQMQKIAQAAGAAGREIFDEEEKLKQQLARQK